MKRKCSFENCPHIYWLRVSGVFKDKLLGFETKLDLIEKNFSRIFADKCPCKIIEYIKTENDEIEETYCTALGN